METIALLGGVVSCSKAVPEVLCPLKSEIFGHFHLSGSGEAVFTCSFSVNANSHHGDRGISRRGLLFLQKMRVCLQAVIASSSC